MSWKKIVIAAEEHEHLTVENEQLKVLYEELLKKIEEEGAIKPPESDKASETAPITQQVNVEQLRSEQWHI